jgi:hypothetical protein
MCWGTGYWALAGCHPSSKQLVSSRFFHMGVSIIAAFLLRGNS